MVLRHFETSNGIRFKNKEAEIRVSELRASLSTSRQKRDNRSKPV
jgi:hypothetical protein